VRPRVARRPRELDPGGVSFASDQLEAIARAEIREDYPLADACVLESLAAATHDAAVPDATAEELAHGAGFAVVLREDWPTDGALLRGTVIVVRRQRRRRMAVAVLHELAHALLLRAGIAHSHGDVWCLTLALAAPRGATRPLAVPAWVVRERLGMPGVRLAG
jgi:hypothetical protein